MALHLSTTTTLVQNLRPLRHEARICSTTRWSVRAGSCPFGFKRSGATSREAISMDRIPTVVDTSTPYAPAPSAHAPDHVNLGPGTYEYLPLKIPYKMTMGIEPLDMDDWIEIDVFYDEEMALRREILETRKGVAVVSTPEAEEANWEVLEMLAEFLPRRFPTRFRRDVDGALLHNLTTGECHHVQPDPALDPLEVISKLIQEDICVMQKVDGTLRLVSGAVLFPQRWHLLQKMGMDMASIHLPVPFYADVIGSAVNHFMEKLKVEKPVWRANWAIDDDSTLFQPLTEEDIYAALQGKVQDQFDGGDDVGSRLFTRCERETLIRLPRTGAILFTIRTYVRPLSVFKSRPLLAKRMAQALEVMPTTVTKYKTMTGFYDVALKYLQDCAAQTLPS